MTRTRTGSSFVYILFSPLGALFWFALPWIWKGKLRAYVLFSCSKVKCSLLVKVREKCHKQRHGVKLATSQSNVAMGATAGFADQVGTGSLWMTKLLCVLSGCFAHNMKTRKFWLGEITETMMIGTSRKWSCVLSYFNMTFYQTGHIIFLFVTSGEIF